MSKANHDLIRRLNKPDAQHNHGRFTSRAFKGRSPAAFDFFYKDMQNQLNQKQRFFCIAVKKPVIPDPPKPLGQNMLHDQMQKVLAF